MALPTVDEYPLPKRVANHQGTTMKFGLLAALIGVATLIAADASAQQPEPSKTSPQLPPSQGTSTTSPNPSATGQSAPPAGGASQEALPEIEVVQGKEAKKTPKVAASKKTTRPAAKQSPAAAAATVAPALVEAAPGRTVQTSPVGGSELPLSKMPGAVGQTTATDMSRSGDIQATEALVRAIPGAILSDQQGNEFQKTLEFRGFDASPVNGQAQGLAVYQNGVRINESFGDIVNWDFLPSNAINNISVIGSDPVFGLNAIGGAVIIGMRDGFNFSGTEIDTRAGSNGRYQGSVATGLKSGNYGMFAALEGIHDDGFRDFSESNIRRLYADLGVKDSTVEMHLNFTGARNNVGATSAAPVELLDLGWNRVYTNPQTTENDLEMVSLNGSVKATPSLTFSGLTYFRHFKQSHLDANNVDASDCGAGNLCLDGDPALTAAGAPIGFNPMLAYSTLDRTSQDADSFGGSLQAVDKSRIFGLTNQFLIGASYDHGNVDYTANSELGFYGDRFVATGFGSGFILSAPDDSFPRVIATTNDYAGVFFSDTLDLTNRLALTLGGRYNYARIDLENQNVNPNTGDTLSGSHAYERFNPSAGLTYQLSPGVTAYGKYAEANRAPTAAELACADPQNPCLIESFLTADPPLKQVVTKTYEAGLRGEIASWSGKHIDWSAGYFNARNQNDILSIAAPEGGRGYFLNAGETLRQGAELGLQYRDAKWSNYANYSYTRATFETVNEFSSPFNPNAVPCVGAPSSTCVNVQPGDRIPGIPLHKFKAGLDYRLTPKWRIGGDLTVASSQEFLGDEGNDSKPLGGYAKIDLHSSYDVTDHIQVYGLINNLFDAHYGLYGTYFDTDAGTTASNGSITFTDPRTITPALPFAAYGGVKVTF